MNHSMSTRQEIPLANPPGGYQEILTPEAVAFVSDLTRSFRPQVTELLSRRRALQLRFDAGERPRFLPETSAIRDAEWTVAPPPADLTDRRVEITGPVDRKMVINALNSGANVFMADFEDSCSPTWDNLIQGQINLRDAVRRTIRHQDPRSGKRYELAARTATLMVRPRGWHLAEKHFLVDQQPAPAALFDFGLFFFHNARALVARGSGPYFYLPKLESHLEARLWNKVFLRAQDRLGLPRGTIRATVLIETLPAAFEMDEILWVLREHSAGLNCGRWDYIFSFIKKLRNDPACVLPDRGKVTMEQPFLRAYTQLLVKTCHRRGIHAMGGMAAQIPCREEPEINRIALEKVRVDKRREVEDGHDGTWVAHPGLVPVAREIFDARLRGANQIERRRDDVRVGAEDLLAVPAGSATLTGLRQNINVGVQYLEAWLGGTGCVPLHHLMEDAATAEICRAQLWQWLRHHTALEGGGELTVERFREELGAEMECIRATVGRERFESGRFREARELFEGLSCAPEFPEFLTVPAYERLLEGTTATMTDRVGEERLAAPSPSRGGLGTLPGSASTDRVGEERLAAPSPSRGGLGTLPGSPSQRRAP
jgi:malate synthase